MIRATKTEDVKKDRWDALQIGDLMTMEGNRVTFTGDPMTRRTGGNSAFLTEVMERGVHRWTFRTNIHFVHWWSATIGIWKCTDNADPPRNNIFTLGENRGYGLNLCQGTLVDTITGRSGPCEPLQTNYVDISFGTNEIEMVLDLNKGELKYIINGHDYGKAFDVATGCSYRAAINLSQIGDSVVLL